MSLGSYVYRIGRSVVGRMIVTPRDTLPPLRPPHSALLIVQYHSEAEALIRQGRLPAIFYLNRHFYYSPSKTVDAKQDCNGYSTSRPTIADDLQPALSAHQPAASPGKKSQDLSKLQLSTTQHMSTSVRLDQTPTNGPGKLYAHKQRVDTLNKKFQFYRERKRCVNKLLKHKGTWSQDWQVPLELLKQHYTVEDEKQYFDGRSRAVWSGPRGIIGQVRADKIPRPLDWSVITFKDYVEDITTSTMDQLMQRQIYGIRESHVTAVANILEELFRNAEMKEYFSEKACNIALTFFYRHYMVNKARAVYTSLEDLHIKLEPETYNLVLRGAAGAKDLHNYTFHLRNFINRGFRPNSRTWSSLLMAVDSKEARRTIAQAMKTRDMLDRFSIMRDVVDLTVRDEVASYLDGGNSMSTFFQYMDSRYAPGWLTVSGANNILDQVAIQGSASEAFELLKAITQRVPVLDNVSLYTLLTHCRQIRAHELAIDILDYYEAKQGISPSPTAYEILFTQAWRSHFYNLVRVIWRFACMDAAVTFKMKKLVMDSLISDIADRTNPQPKSRAEIWKMAAGKVTVGIDLATYNGAAKDFQHPGTIFTDLVQEFSGEEKVLSAHLAQFTDDADFPRPKSKALQAAKALVYNDLAVSKKYRTKRKLVSLLREALTVDREWAKCGLKHSSIGWKRRNAIAVEVKVEDPQTLVRRCTATVDDVMC